MNYTTAPFDDAKKKLGAKVEHTSDIRRVEGKEGNTITASLGSWVIVSPKFGKKCLLIATSVIIQILKFQHKLSQLGRS